MIRQMISVCFFFFLVGYQREKKLGFSYIFGSSIYICKIFLCVCVRVVYFKREKWFSFCFVFFVKPVKSSLHFHISRLSRSFFLHCIPIHFTEFMEFEWKRISSNLYCNFNLKLMKFSNLFTHFFSFSIIIIKKS